MIFRPDELIPEYTETEIEKLFFVRKDLSDLSPTERQQLLDKVNRLGLKNTRYDNVLIILTVLHEARELDDARFINEVFLPWFSVRQKTSSHLARIAGELARIDDFDAGSVDEASHLVNVYRNQVADLFDPYMTLLVACFQFNEGTFTSLLDADLTNGERTKSEYLTRRVNAIFSGDSFLSGYDPRVRNAISHTGAHGITYLSDRVVFKSIKRGTDPRVETVSWTFDELQTKILQLIECVLSIETAVELFGLDCTSLLTTDFSTQLNFAYHALSPDQLSEWRKRGEAVASAIRDAGDTSPEEKLKTLSEMLFYNLNIRNMDCLGVRVASEKSLLCIDVPISLHDTDDDQKLLERLQQLVRYAIIARSVFSDSYSTFLVVETDKERKQQRLSGEFLGTALDEWIAEEAGLVDLLNDSTWKLKGHPLGVEVDFAQLSQIELKSPEMPFPRRNRDT